MSPIPGAWLLIAALLPEAAWPMPTPTGATVLDHDGFVSALAFAPDGKTLFTASADQFIRVWDPVTRKEVRRLAGHTDAVLSLALAPDGKTLASGSSDGTVRLWEPATGKEVRVLKGHRGDVLFVAFAPNGAALASADSGNRGEYRVVRTYGFWCG